MNFDLTEDQRKLQATVADFAQSEVAPVAEALDRDGVFPTELFKKAGELGITAIPFSEDLGGMYSEASLMGSLPDIKFDTTAPFPVGKLKVKAQVVRDGKIATLGNDWLPVPDLPKW